VQRRLHERKEQEEEVKKRELAMEELLCLFIPSLSLSLSLSPWVFPTAAPGQCFFRNFFVRRPSTDFFCGEFSPFFEKNWKKKYPVSNSLF
jgi:hypothetical protein